MGCIHLKKCTPNSSVDPNIPWDEKEKIKIYYPELSLCTDNAAMIAVAGYYEYISGKKSELSLNAIPNLKLGE